MTKYNDRIDMLLFDNYPLPVFIYDSATFQFLHINQAAVHLYGYSENEFLKMTLFDLLSENESYRLLKLTDNTYQALEDGTKWQHHLKDGKIIDVELKSDSVMIGDRYAVLSIVSDVTERLKTELELKENYQILKNFFAVSVDLFCIANQDGIMLKVNKSWENLLGIALKDIEGVNFMDYVHPDDHLSTLKIMSYLRKGKKVNNFVNRYRKSDGKYLHLEWRSRQVGNLIYASARNITEKMVLEQRLSDSEKTLQEIFNSLEEVVWVTDLKTRQITFITPSVENLFGYSTEEFRENHQLYLDKVHPDDIHLVKRLSDFDDTGNNLESQYRIIRADGQIRWILNKMCLIHDPQGNPIRMVGIIIDITKIKELENENLNISSFQQILLGMANNFINLPIDKIDDAIHRTLGQVGSFVGADRAYIFDYDFTNNTCSNTYEWCAREITPEIDNLQKVPMDEIDYWVQTHLKNEAMIIENVFELAETDGVRLILEPQCIKSLITLPMFDQNELVGFIGFDSVKQFKSYNQSEQELLQLMAGIIVNANNRKGFERALIESEVKFRQLADNVDDMFWLNDVESQNILYKNPAFIQFFGDEPGESNSNLESLFQNISWGEKDQVRSSIKSNSMSGPDEMEIMLYNRLKELRWFRLRIHPVITGEGTVKRQIGIATDITGLKKAEVALKEALELEKKLGDLKSSFVTMASHEFRTPLASIMMAADTLQYYRSRLNEEDISKYLDRITRNVEFLRDIISKVLNLSKIESGKIPFAPEKMELSLLADSWLNDFNHQQTVTHKIILNTPATKTWVEIDPQLFIQALQNLVSNSIKYSAGNSEIVITVKQQNDLAIISIADQGAGIPEEDFPYLFDPFFRSKNIENVHGTGLGLPIVKQIIERHNGKVYFTSKINTGTTFYIEIPLSE